jgi:hypothetical protein
LKNLLKSNTRFVLFHCNTFLYLYFNGSLTIFLFFKIILSGFGSFRSRKCLENSNFEKINFNVFPLLDCISQINKESKHIFSFFLLEILLKMKYEAYAKLHHFGWSSQTYWKSQNNHISWGFYSIISYQTKFKFDNSSKISSFISSVDFSSQKSIENLKV